MELLADTIINPQVTPEEIEEQKAVRENSSSEISSFQNPCVILSSSCWERVIIREDEKNEHTNADVYIPLTFVDKY